ncbi:MAG: GNAT family N-acetyltransferase [Alphaproteobacteria bacterium]|nr:GNAT family N-acetyltransferase [Alphaproteobacteria bacterium]
MAHADDKQPSFETPRLRLRPLSGRDALDLHPVFSDPETTHYLDFATCRSLQDTMTRIGMATIVMPQWHATWAIVLRETGAVIGILNYHHRESWHCRLEIGYVLARPYWRRGLMREAVQPLLRYCFEGLRMHRIEATIVPDNIAGIRFAESLGFQQESGILRDRLRVGAEYRDIVMYGLLHANWLAAAASVDAAPKVLEAVAG